MANTNYINANSNNPADKEAMSQWQLLLQQAQQRQQDLAALNAAQNASPQTMAGFALGKLLSSLYGKWQANYDERGNEKAKQALNEEKKRQENMTERMGALASDGGYDVSPILWNAGETPSAYDVMSHSKFSSETETPMVKDPDKYRTTPDW